MTRPLSRLAFVCLLFLLTNFGLAQKVVTARATIPFNVGAQGHEFQVGDYVFDNEAPGSERIGGEGPNSGVRVSIILSAVPKEKESPGVIFVRRDDRYFLVEISGVQDRHVATAKFAHRGQVSAEQRQARLTIVESDER
jgi:hypothetical protein